MAPREIEDVPERGRQITRDVLATIRQIRREQHACTAGEVARLMKVPKGTTVHRLEQLRDRGLVEWGDLPGSVRLTLRGGRVLDWLEVRRDG